MCNIMFDAQNGFTCLRLKAALYKGARAQNNNHPVSFSSGRIERGLVWVVSGLNAIKRLNKIRLEISRRLILCRSLSSIRISAKRYHIILEKFRNITPDCICCLFSCDPMQCFYVEKCKMRLSNADMCSDENANC